MRKIKKCNKCNIYTLKVRCPKCNSITKGVLPPKFSPRDRYGKYRRKIKRCVG